MNETPDKLIKPMNLTPEIIMKYDQHLVDFMVGTSSNVKTLTEIVAKLMREVAVELTSRPNYTMM